VSSVLGFRLVGSVVRWCVAVRVVVGSGGQVL
jgi:hypothetical protein